MAASGWTWTWMLALQLLFLQAVPMVGGEFLHFKSGVEYQYKFQSNAKVEGLNTFDVKGRVAYSTVQDQASSQELRLRIVHLNMGFKDVHSGENALEGWDFSRWFSFNLTRRGQIPQVTYDPHDPQETLAFKKGFAALLASTLHGDGEEEIVKPTDNGWTYDVTELGHEGWHNATYRVKRNSDGNHVFTKTRQGHPVEHAKANYTKTIHYNQKTGIIHSVQVKEDVKPMGKAPPGFDPKHKFGASQLDGDFKDIDLPEMRAMAYGHLEFLYQEPADVPRKPTSGLEIGSIQIDNNLDPNRPKVSVQQLHVFVQGNLTCMRWEPARGSPKLTSCFRGLSTAIDLLPEDEVLKLATSYLEPNSTFYSRDREAILDTLSTTSVESVQTRLAQLLFLHVTPEVDMMHRYLMHLAGMDHVPSPYLLNALKSLVFQPESHPVVMKSTQTYHRALLTLGGVARTLSDKGMGEEAHRIMGALRAMLGVHDPGAYRIRRATLNADDALSEDVQKVVLLESLGNAGIDSCYETIVSHVNATNSPWVKRAAMHALRSFQHQHAADVIMMRALTDEDETVKYEASHHYARHPKADPAILAKLREIHADQPSSQPEGSQSAGSSHHRHRRSTRSEALEFKVKSPHVDWTKVVGSKEIGASFGANKRNEFEFKTGLLTSEMTMDIADEVFARVNLGFMNANVDVLTSRMCFKAKADFDVNMLQEYDSTEADRLTELYDNLKENVSQSIITSLDRFRTIIDSSTQLGLIIKAYADAIEDLPNKVLHIGESALSALETLGQLDAEEMPAFVAPLWRLANKVINLYNDIKNDVMGFYMKLLDTTVVIPYGSKQIYTAVTDIINNMDDFNDDPKSGMTTVSANTVLIGNTINSMISALQEAKERAFFNRKIKPYWWNLKQEKDELNVMASEATEALSQAGATWVSNIINDDLKEFSDGRMTLTQLRLQVVNSLTNIPSDLITPFSQVSDLGDDLQKAFTDALDLMEDMKNAYEDLRIGVKAAQEMVNRVFGAKVHRDFPKVFRDAAGNCLGNGMYESSMGHSANIPEYSRKGIDLVVNVGDTIVAPFAGYVQRNRSAPREVILEVSASLLSDITVYIENVVPDANILYPDDSDYLPNFVAAGDTIGVATTSYCIKHIHVSMKKENRAFIDPSPYLQARVASLPTWTQECDDYKFVYKGQTVAAGSIVGSVGKLNNDTSPTRRGNTVSNPAAISANYDPSVLVDQDITNTANLGNQLKSIILSVADAAALSRDEGLKKLVIKPWLFVGNYNLKDLKVGSLATFLNTVGHQSSLDRLNSVFQGIQSLVNYRPCLNPYQMADDKLRLELQVQGKNSTGTRPELMDRFLAREDSCMSVSLGLPKEMYCKVDPQCMGVECCLTVKLFMFKKNYKFYTRYDPCSTELVVGIDQLYEHIIGPDLDMDDIFGGFSDLTLNTGVVESSLNAELILKMSLEKSDTQITLSASAGFCRLGDWKGTNCLVFITILDKAVMALPVCGPAPLRKLTFRTVNLQAELRNQKEKFSEDSKKVLSQEVDSTVSGLVGAIPCLSSDLNNATTLPCPRPDKMTQANLIEALALRGLSTAGSKNDLIARLEQSDRTCQEGNYSIPAISNATLAQKVYLTISDDCRLLEACVDFTYQNFPVSVHSSIRLDECTPSLTTSFEECTQDMVLFSTNLNTTGRLRLTDTFIVDYQVQQDLPVNEYIFDLSLKVQIDSSSQPEVDEAVMTNFRVPIPVCNSSDYNLPHAANTFSSLASTFGGYLSTDMVAYLFRMLHLNDVLTTSCSLPTAGVCAENLTSTVYSYLPQDYKSKVSCVNDLNCQGLVCCMSYNFSTLPHVNTLELKNMPFELKFDPCDNMKVKITFGNFFQQEQLLDYEFGNEKTISVGVGENTGDSAPIVIRYKVKRLFQTAPYDEAFLIDASVSVGIPMDGTIHYFPSGGLTLMQNERIEICPAANTTTLEAFDLNSFATSRGENASTQLNTGTVLMIVNEFGLTPQLKRTQCNIAKSPYVPNLRGWRDDCDSSLFNLPATLDENTVCHMSSSCTRVDCCYYSPILDMSFNVFFDLNVCNYYIQGGIENKVYPARYLLNETGLDWTNGVNGTFEISNAIRLEYNVRKTDVNFDVDLFLKLCLGNACQDIISIYHDTRIPQKDCETTSTQSLRDVSFQFWNWAQCQLQTPSVGCAISLPANYSQNCVMTNNCKTIQCCHSVDVVVARTELEVTFTSDVCSDSFTYTFETKTVTRSITGLPGVNNQTAYIVETVGDAINLTIGVQKEATGLTVSAELYICTEANSVTSCTTQVLLNNVQIYDPQSACSIGRKKRSVTVDTSISRDAQMLSLINTRATTSDIESYFAQLEQIEADRCTQLKTGASNSVSEMNPKAVLEAMGSRSPSSIVHCNDSSILSSTIEGAYEISSQLNTTTDIAGRTSQLYVPGRGLTRRGVNTLAHMIANMTLGELTAYVMAQDNMQPELVIQLLEDMRQLLYSLYSDAMTSIQGGGVSNQFSSSDLDFDGTFNVPTTNEVFMRKRTFFMVGGLVPMSFSFESQISYGMDIEFSAQAMHRHAQATMTPYASLQAQGTLDIGVVVQGNLQLSGSICDVRFPSTSKMNFNTFPIDVDVSMDMELIPLELKLAADISVDIILSAETVSKSLYSSNLWYYRTPSIRKRVLDVERKEEDTSLPQFITVEDDGVTNVTTVVNCQVRQLPNLDYTDPRIEVIVDAGDDRSKIKLTLDIGTSLGLSDVRQGYEMGGPQIVITERLTPAGVPLYFRVTAENTEGITNFVTCSLPTYDITLPNGRLTAEFKSSSNSHILKASAVIYEDSALVSSRIAVGLGRNIYSDGVQGYQDVNFTSRVVPTYSASSDPLGETALSSHFTGQKIGRLVVASSLVVADLQSVSSPGMCAKSCMSYASTKCMSFNFNSNGDCQLLEAIESETNALSVDGLYRHYERLAFGLASEFSFPIELTHNTLYYMVLHLTNNLGFQNLLSTGGTLVDLTPPEPGTITMLSDSYSITDCESNLPEDRRNDWKIWCVGIDTNFSNHRTIVDAAGSMTVFNGHEPLVDLLYTKDNTYISANWDGIHDDESGILGYSFAVGTTICGEEVKPHHDPYKHLLPIDDDSQWTGIGVVELPEGRKLPDGRYYVTVRAINQVEYGGPLVTTICHSTPLAIDNSPPLVYEVYNIRYDDVTHDLTANFNATDPESDIKSVYMCLGLNSLNCDILGWTQTPSLSMIQVNFEIPDGQRAWIRLRVTNNVDLRTDAVASYPIVVDNGGPNAGTVYDGNVVGEDLVYSYVDDQFCANWQNFYDEESGISHFFGAVVDSLGTLISNETQLSSMVESTCVSLPTSTLQHNSLYKYRLTAVNSGHKQLNVTVESNGVTIDLTNPTVGQVVDGQLGGFTDQTYSVSTSTVSAQWRNFADAESTVANYAVKVTRRGNLGAGSEVTVQEFDTLDNYTSTVEYNHLMLQHRDVVKTTVKAINGATGSSEAQTDGIIIDLTPPVMTSLFDGNSGSDIKYTSSQGTLSSKFQFTDSESGIERFKFQIYQTYQGSRHQLYPSVSNTWVEDTNAAITSKTLTGFTMSGGALYSMRVAAVNNAGAVATYDTDGVIYDNSAPTMGGTMKVGAFSSESEVLIGGYVHQADTSGIKASWTATDGESGILYFEVAVGTSQYATDILSWRNVGKVTDLYIDGLTLSTTSTVTNTPVYYVAVKATNGAGQVSSTRASSPIKVLQENRAGTVTDGPLNSNNLALAGIADIDFQKDKTTVTAQFRGFASYVHGIVRFDWAVGTTPGGEEVQPFMTAGIMHDETESGVPGQGLASRGVAHAAIPLQEGVTYYSTIRGITNDGTVLQSTSNGFKVDNTPPVVSFVSYAQEGPSGTLSEGSVVYRQGLDTLSADWLFSDALNRVTNLTYGMGSFPDGDDLYSAVDMSPSELLVGEASLPGNQITPVDDGRANILTVTVADEVGLTKTIVSSSLVIDKTAPIQGVLTCPAYIQSHNPIDCVWEGFHDAESPIVSFDFEISVGESLTSIHTAALASDVTSYITPSLHGTVKHGYSYFAIVTATNALGMSSSVTSDPIRIDSTAPVAGTVVEISNTYHMYFNDSTATDAANVFICNATATCNAIDTTCQESLTSVYVAWSDFSDPETGIVAYQIAVGTSVGGGQIKAYFNVPIDRQYYQVNGLNLNGYRQIYVSVKAFNGAGMATVATSNGVYMSYISQGITPPQPFSVWDQDSIDGDIDYQTSRTTITARWDVSGDPCPVLKYEWAIERVDGVTAQDFYDTNGQSYGLNDDLTLYGLETYYQLLRVTTAMNNFTYILRSDGVTVVDQPLYPGYVYDGDVTAIDLQYQPFTDKISANWEAFGEKNEVINSSIQVISGNNGVVRQDKPPNQEIVRYEVAVGTDRRFENTRNDIVAWTDVGLNNSVTFYDLNLVVETAIYYFTVKAYSTANTMAEVTSNGFAIRHDVGVTGGIILIGDYVNASSTLPFKWEGFESNVEILIYYVALSSSSVPTIDCDHVIEGGPMLDNDRTAIFDLVDRTNNGENTYTEMTGLNLAQDTDYWVSVIAVDEASKCKILTKQIHIDTTSPLEGKMKNGPYYDMNMSYTPHLRAIDVQWENYTDAESGLDTVQLELYRKMSCSASETRPDLLINVVTIAGTYTSYRFLDLNLNASEPYYIIMTVYNKAQLSVVTTSSVILLDPSTNTAGTVIDGINPLSDAAWAGSQSEVKATILYLPQSSGSFCPPQSLLNTDSGWRTLISSVNNDHTGRVLNLNLRDANVQLSALNPEEIVVKLARDTSTNEMYSGAICRDAELAYGGKYEMDIKAAHASQSVTSVLFWDGPEDYVTHYDFTAPDTTPYCSCCDDLVPSATCESICGGCSTYIANRLVTGKRKRRSINQVMALTALQKQTLISSGNANSISATATANPTQSACGMQLYKDGNVGRLVLWATFTADYSYEPRYEEFALDFDPSDALHHYSIEVYSVADEAANPTWCMEVAIDNAPSDISLCGLPQLSTNTTLMMTLWNWKNYVPTVNATSVFATLWSVESTFKNVIIPASKEELCRYEVPFRGANDGVVSFEAGIGTTTSLDDIVPFSRVHDPCIPCLNDCNRYHCNSSCTSDLVTTTLTLNGLNLPLNFTDVNGNNKPRTYYFTVRAMLASGLSAVASSDGFNIDVTAPTFDTTAFQYLDTSHDDEIRPALQYLGSDSTIKSAWECQDGESDVVGYTWAIGTTIGGTEIQNFTSVGEDTEGINADLLGILTDGVKYYVSVTCTNGAGLTTTYNDASGITVTLTLPDISAVSLSMVGMSTVSANTVPSTARMLYSQNSFQLDFTVDPNPDINEYYFKICSQDTECDDVFERTLISNRQSGRLRIYNGRLYKDGQAMFELQQVKRSYNSTVANAVNSDAFHMEPGRQIFPYIDGCTEAQCSTKSFGAIVIATARSQTVTSTSGESITTSINVGYAGKRKRSASGIDITTPSGLAPGQTIDETTLLESEMTDSYDSAAASGFVPIITSPAATVSDSNYLDRILYSRVTYSSSNDEAFVLTSVGDIEMPGPLVVNYPYVPSDTVNTWLLLHWNPSSQKWELSHETCTSESNTYVEDSGSSTITIKVCNTRGNSTHNSTYTYFREDTQFLLTNVLDLIPNTPPVLTNSVTNSMLEDSGTLVYQLQYADDEGDTVTFATDESVMFTQMNAELNLSTSGLLLFTPCADCNGDYKKVITITEDPITGVASLTSTYTVTITVNSVNDAPTAFAFLNGVDLLASDPTEPVEVLLEENRFNTTDNTNYTFIFGAYDYDDGDSLTVTLSSTVNGTLTLISSDTTTPTCSASGIPCNSMGLIHAASDISWIYHTYNYVPNDDYWGIDPAQVYVSDANSSLSSVVTMNFSVMARPCENDGACMVPVNVSAYTCNNVNRALSFIYFYECNCTAGFEGTYCQLDVDECANDPCKWPYVCIDEANGFTCKCPSDNPTCDGLEGWMIGVAVVGFLVLIVIVVLLWYFFAIKRGRVVWGNLLSSGNKYRTMDTSSSDTLNEKGKNHNFDNTKYMVEEQDEDGFNNVFDTMKSSQAGQQNVIPRPSITSLPPIPPNGPMPLAAAPVATHMATANKPSAAETQLPAEETITPPESRRGSYLPRNASASSLHKSNKMRRRSSTSSWLNNLLNNSDIDPETPRSRPITPIEHPEEEEDDEDDLLFFT